MPDSDDAQLLSIIQGSGSQVRARTTLGLDANPDDAARAVDLSSSTGVPATVINGDLEHFDKQYQGALARSLVLGNPQLRDYVNSHPLAAAVSSDDWGNLSKIADATSAFGRLHQALSQSWQVGVGQAVEEGAKEGFGQGPLFPVSREGLAQQYPALTPGRSAFSGLENLLATTGLNLGDLFLRGTQAVFGGLTSGLGAMVGAAAGPSAGREAKALAEYEVIKPEGGIHMELSAEPPGAPWVKAGKEPPAGLHPEIDKAKADLNEQGLKVLEDTVKEAQTSTTKERSPEMFQNFVRQFPELRNASIGINGDAVAALYRDKPPTPDDGLLGWVPGIADKLELAKASGGDVEVPIADWIGKVDPAVAKSLHDHIRLWDGGVTAAESRFPTPIVKPDSDLGQMRQAGGLNPVVAPEDFANLKASGVDLPQSVFDKLATDTAEQQRDDLAKVQAFAEREQARRQTKEWKDNSTAMRPEVEEALRQDPAVAADLFVGAGEHNGQKLRQRFPLLERDMTPEQQASLPDHYASKTGIPIDEAAKIFGFGSGDSLISALAAHVAARGEDSPKVYFDKLVASEVNRRMETQYGKLTENILAEAKAQALSEATLNLLTDEYMAAALRANVTAVDRATIQAEAEAKVDALPLRDIKSSKQMATTGSRWREALAAMAEDDKAAALQAMQRRVLSAFMTKRMVEIEKEQAKFDKATKYYAKAWDPTKAEGQKVAPNFSIFIRDILGKVGIRNGMSGPGLAKAIAESGFANLTDFINKTEAEFKVAGLELPVPNWLLNEYLHKEQGELSVADWGQLRDAVTALDRVGRLDQKINRGLTEMDRADWIAQARAQLAKKFDPIPADKKRGLLNQAVTTAIAASTNNETLMSRFDGRDPHGLFTETITKPAAEAANLKARLQRETTRDYRALGEIKNRDKLVESPFIDRRTMQPWTFTRKNLAAVISNMGNAYNWSILAKGWNLDPEALMKWVESVSTPEDIDRAQALGNIFKGLKEGADREYRALYGIAPENVVPRPFTMHGKQYEGWYHPIIGDPQLSRFVNKMPDPGVETNFFPSTSNTYMKRRTGAVQVIDLTYDSIPARIDQVIHDTAFHSLVFNQTKIFRDERFRDAIRTYYGKEYMEEMDQWNQRIAGDSSYNTGAMQIASKLSNILRQNVITTQIAFNLGTVEKHGLTAWLMSARELGPNPFITIPKFTAISAEVAPSLFKRAVLDMFGKSPELGDSIFDFIKRSSEEIQRRDRNFLDTMIGQQAQFEGKSTIRNRLSQAGAKMVAFSDMLSAAPLWLAKYREEMERNGGNPGDAIRDADFAVRRAHGSTAVTNLPRIAASQGPIGPWLTSLYGFMGTSMQRRIEIFHDVNDAYKLGMHGDIKAAMAKVPTILSSVAVYVVWTGVVEEAITGQFTDDRRGLGTKALTFLFGTVAQSIIGLRDIVHDVEYAQDSAGLISTPIHDVIRAGRDIGIKDPLHPIRDLERRQPLSKEHAGRLVQDGCAAIGDLFGYCPKHIGTAARYGLDVFDEYQHPRSAIDVYRGAVSGQQKLRVVK